MSDSARSFDAAEILAIPVDEPERLYPNSIEELTRSFRKLAQQWHPDRCKDPRAGDVFSHIGALREAAENKIRDGRWSEPDVLALTARDGRSYRLRYGFKQSFELGQIYIGRSHVAYVVDKDFSDLFTQGVRVLRNFSFSGPEMKKEMGRNLPGIVAELETNTANVLVVRKDPEQIRLRELLTSCGGKIDPRHAAWILSNLYNLACYLRWSGLTHNDLSLDTVFVSPEHHGGAVLGGWWYATAIKKPLRALPNRSVELAPADVLRKPMADARVDLELIRAIGRELLGDPRGSSLSWNKEVPRPLADWLRAPTTGDALTEYRLYRDHVLPGSFGARRFVKWDINLSNPYQPRR